MSGVPTSEQTNTCQLSNQTGVDIVVLNSTDKLNSIQQLYENSLQFILDTNGNKVISSGANISLLLEDHEGQLQDHYALIIARADDLSPLQVILQSKDASTNSFSEIKVSSDRINRMKQAELFQKTMQAFPTSNVVDGYQKTLSDAKDNANSTEEIETSVARYLNGFKPFKGLQLSDVAATQTYSNKFAAAYIKTPTDNGPALATYYLYSSDNGTLKSQGTLTIAKKTTPLSPNLTDGNGNYTISYQDTAGNSTPLTYIAGQFINGAKATDSTIVLQPIYSASTKESDSTFEDTFFLSVVGMIKGIQVMGTMSKKSNDSSDVEEEILHIILIILPFLGLVISLTSLAYTLWYRLYKSKASLKKLRADLENDMNDALAKMQENLELSLGVATKIPRTRGEFELLKSSLKYKTQLELANEGVNNLNNILNKYYEKITEVAKFGLTDELENAQGTLIKARKTLEGVDVDKLDSLGAAYMEVSKSITDIDENVEAAILKLVRAEYNKISESIENANDAIDFLSKYNAEIENQFKQVESGEISEEEF